MYYLLYIINKKITLIEKNCSIILLKNYININITKKKIWIYIETFYFKSLKNKYRINKIGQRLGLSDPTLGPMRYKSLVMGLQSRACLSWSLLFFLLLFLNNLSCHQFVFIFIRHIISLPGFWPLNEWLKNQVCFFLSKNSFSIYFYLMSILLMSIN